MKKIGEIKDEFAAAGEADWQSMCDCYREDPRSGVQKLILQYEKKIKALEAETLRMEQMMQYERKYEHLGYLCGIDEVGRGPLAGPVVACAVILPADHQILCITHLPQIASMEEKHFLIEKTAENGRTTTHIRALDEEESCRELARMMGGERLTETTLQSAREMKEMAREARQRR